MYSKLWNSTYTIFTMQDFFYQSALFINNTMFSSSQQKRYPHNSSERKSGIFEMVLNKICSLFIKLTFPLWMIPYFAVLLCMKFLNFWRHLGSLIGNLVYPNTPPQLAYALLKGNGQYLRDKRETVLIRQFYDYTSRKFMSISQLEHKSVIVELQCDNDVGINYLSQCVKPENVKGLISDFRLAKNIGWPQKKVIKTNYSIQGESQQVDCFLLFNFKSKINFLGKSSVDLMKILDYCSYHLSKDGYLVYGDYFQQGQAQNFIKLFRAYKLEIVEQEDITKNIEYAKKLLSRDRNHFEVKFVTFFKNIFSNFSQRKPYECGKTFQVFILQSRK